MNLSHISLGHFDLYSIETGRFRLDGGAMFGVVPKTLWSRAIDVDDKNRIPMAMRCLLIKSNKSGRTYLIDNGSGTKFNDKFEDIYQLDHEHSNLLSSLSHHGFDPEDITDVIFSHLHFDHCGGTTYYDEDNNLQHQFPNATYHVTERHLETAQNPNAREKASFLPDNIEPIANWDKLNTVDEYHTYEKGLDALPVNGHTISQQLPRITADDKTIVFMADLVPTHIHLPLPWVMGYDMYPVKTLNEKQQYLDQAVENDWFLFLEHDAEEEVITASKENGKYVVDERLRLNDI
ncbi:Glyoxylase, beta-lactamase superfamily II [Fodinibius salinus]|uniref:Glyoxylase, beta-lactamase superfamily II n=1 Tax=Fodinibius salinus TaxID=860790 RepID=A0A5D3YQL7_9BACT|nr:MBL fold metallo-hydrolase [Fodinibius salinus]TYP95608.1 Glyoxylase, beta-lactamase superfamily II [Fodinibius salinus]